MIIEILALFSLHLVYLSLLILFHLVFEIDQGLNKYLSIIVLRHML